MLSYNLKIEIYIPLPLVFQKKKHLNHISKKNKCVLLSSSLHHDDAEENKPDMIHLADIILR